MRQEFINLNMIKNHIEKSLVDKDYGELKAVVYLYEKTYRHIDKIFPNISEEEYDILQKHKNDLSERAAYLTEVTIPIELGSRNIRGVKDVQESLEVLHKISTLL